MSFEHSIEPTWWNTASGRKNSPEGVVIDSIPPAYAGFVDGNIGALTAHTVQG